ncbi:TPA: SPFH domain-containing protein [Streptococcus suis]|nr:SPFH domain-containing protein [Streptococcus suis]
MGLFSGKNGGFMDQIRCDEPSYLIWKWHPVGSKLGKNTKENSIRFGSSLRVRDGEVAVFVYNQPNGIMEDFIEGPHDRIIETKNFPVLASIVGLAYAGGTPFQAEVYYINLARVIQVAFAVPFFDVYDPRFLDFGVPTAVRGKISFNIADYRKFIKLNRLRHFDFDDFQNQIKSAVGRYVKNVVTNIPVERNIPVVQIERAIGQINELIEVDIKHRLLDDFGVNVSALDIASIEIDKTSDGYRQLKTVTQDLATATTQAQVEVDIKNMQDIQRINATNMEENLRIQREETQYAQRKQTQSANFATYQLEQQAAVGIAGAEALGQMGMNSATEINGCGGMNPVSMMAGMAMGGVIGQNMAGMMNGMMNGVNDPQLVTQQSPQGIVPPPIPNVNYYVVQNGQATGPFDLATLSHMISTETLIKDSLVWKQGMPDWVKAETLEDFRVLFNSSASLLPPIPPQV